MATTYIYYDGGTRNGTTEERDLNADEDIWFDGVHLDANERYGRTDETRSIDGVTHIVYRLHTT